MTPLKCLRATLGVVVLLGALVCWAPLPTPSLYKPSSGPQSSCRWREEHLTESPFRKPHPTLSNEPLFYTLRFTDDGEFAQRCELSDILLELEATKERLTVVYVHGWNHDATPDDPDVTGFKAWLATLQKTERQRSTLGGRRVIGIYVSWNGAPLLWPFNYATFWTRKKATDLITHSGRVTQALSKIHNIDQLRRKDQTDECNLTIYLGHSFGARILFSALSDVMINELEAAYPKERENKAAQYGRIEGPGDLVILLNPAFEASFYGAFQSLVRPRPKLPNGEANAGFTFSAGQEPLMLTLGASTDLATRYAFPIGQILGLDFRDIRRTTLGNYEEAFTHSMSDEKALPSASAPRRADVPWYDDFCAGTVCLSRLTGGETISPRGDPFIVARAPPSVIQGHGGIWNDKLEAFLTDFVTTTLEKRPKPPEEDDEKCKPPKVDLTPTDRIIPAPPTRPRGSS